VVPGDTLTGRLTVGEVREENGQTVVELTVSTTNQDGTEVFSGYATARVD
jgi:acyl dehydratase